MSQGVLWLCLLRCVEVVLCCVCGCVVLCFVFVVVLVFVLCCIVLHLQALLVAVVGEAGSVD